MGKFLLDESPLMVLPTLACAVGLEEAIALQQLHFLSNNPNMGVVKDGRKWIRMTAKEWHERNFSFWTETFIQKLWKELEDKQLIDATCEFNDLKMDRRKWYAINHNTLEATIPQNCGNDSAESRIGIREKCGLESAKSAECSIMSKTESKTESFLLQTDVCTKRKKPRKQLNGYNPVAVWCEVARRKLHVPIGVTGVETKLLTELGNMYNEKELRAMIAQYALSKPDSNARWNLQWEFHKDHLHWRRKAGAMDAPVDLGNEDRLEQLYGANSGARIEIPLEMKA